MLSFISDLRRRRPLSTYPPGRTSSPQAPVYLVFQPIRFTPAGIADGGVSSYLAFSPLPFDKLRAVIFCGTCCCPCGHLPVKKYGALCCPDFPRAGFPGPRQSGLNRGGKSTNYFHFGMNSDAKSCGLLIIVVLLRAESLNAQEKWKRQQPNRKTSSGACCSSSAR